MKTTKNSKESCSSSSSSSSSNTSDSDSEKSQLKSPEHENRKESNQQSKIKDGKEQRSLNRDVKSKWDSPDERIVDKKRGNRSSSLRDQIQENRSGRRDISSEKPPDKNDDRHSDRDKHRHRENSRDRDRYNKDKNPERNYRKRESPQRYKDRQHNRSDQNNSRNYNHKERRSARERSRSPHRPHVRSRHRSRSKSFDHSKAVWGKSNNEKKPPEAPVDKEKPNFGLSGKLTEETNTYKGVVIKYSEPPEARKPKRRWRLYPFKGEKAMQTLYIHRESAYLVGRDRKVVDLPVDHPSCSKQHAAIQYRLVQFTRDNGSIGKRVRPYLIDLESANGTFINNKKIEARKYVELLERDVIKFGFSSREYVLLHENSKDEAQDDDVNEEIAREATPTQA